MKGSSFQTIILAVFGALVFIAVLVFAGVIHIGKKNTATTATGNVVLWGTLHKDQLGQVFDDFNTMNKTFSVLYIQKDPATFDGELVNAIASGSGPDLIMLSQDSILSLSNKLYHIPYTSLPERTFRDTFADEGVLYLAGDGIIALPFTIDPLILYYNKGMLQSAGITTPPKTWDDVVTDLPLLTKKSGASITQGGIALGTFSNIAHASDVISLLILQTGNPITAANKNGGYYSLLTEKFGGAIAPAEAALGFYTQFSDPLKDTYTWNSAQSNSRDAFTSEGLAFYIGYASELPVIAAKNPNLNFDITKIPQLKSSTTFTTYGNMTGIAMVKSTKNPATAFTVASKLTGADFETTLINKLLETAPIAPATRSILATPPQNLYGPTLFYSALNARGWLAPGKSAVNTIFGGMVSDIIRGALSTTDAMSKADNLLTNMVH